VLSAADRTAELLERYPDLCLLRGCDWERLDVTTVFGLLYGSASQHFANLRLAARMDILSTVGVTREYAIEADHSVRTTLTLMASGTG
jgi:hypothetical protein